MILQLFCLLLISVQLLGQSPFPIDHNNRCLSLQKRRYNFQKHPELLEKSRPLQETTTQWEKNQLDAYSNQNSPETIITIPVVVHVVYKNALQNISMAQINSQLQVLNEDYRKMNADFTTVVPPAFQPLAADVVLSKNTYSDPPIVNTPSTPFLIQQLLKI